MAKVVQVTMWQASDGSMHTSFEEAMCRSARLDGRLYKCPKCSGTGKQNGGPKYEHVEDKEATAWGGQFARPVFKCVQVGHVKVMCSLCDGWGYTKRKMVQKMMEVPCGWEEQK